MWDLEERFHFEIFHFISCHSIQFQKLILGLTKISTTTTYGDITGDTDGESVGTTNKIKWNNNNRPAVKINEWRFYSIIWLAPKWKKIDVQCSSLILLEWITVLRERKSERKEIVYSFMSNRMYTVRGRRAWKKTWFYFFFNHNCYCYMHSTTVQWRLWWWQKVWFGIGLQDYEKEEKKSYN